MPDSALRTKEASTYPTDCSRSMEDWVLSQVFKNPCMCLKQSRGFACLFSESVTTVPVHPARQRKNNVNSFKTLWEIVTGWSSTHWWNEQNSSTSALQTQWFWSRVTFTYKPLVKTQTGCSLKFWLQVVHYCLHRPSLTPPSTLRRFCVAGFVTASRAEAERHTRTGTTVK